MRTCILTLLTTLCAGAPAPRPTTTSASISVAMPLSTSGPRIVELPVETMTALLLGLDPKSAELVKECYAKCSLPDPVCAICAKPGVLGDMDEPHDNTESSAVAAPEGDVVEKRQLMGPVHPCWVHPEWCTGYVDKRDLEDAKPSEEVVKLRAVAAEGHEEAENGNSDPVPDLAADWHLEGLGPREVISESRTVAADGDEMLEKRQEVQPYGSCYHHPECCNSALKLDLEHAHCGEDDDDVARGPGMGDSVEEKRDPPPVLDLLPPPPSSPPSAPEEELCIPVDGVKVCF